MKVMVFIRLMGTGNAYEQMDDGGRMGKEAIRRYLKQFFKIHKRTVWAYVF